MNYIIVSILLLSSILGISQSSEDALLIFTDSTTHSPVIKDFNANYLTDIQSLGDDIDIKVEIRNLSEGLPKEVTTLPSIYYINNTKKSYYKGRYHTITKVKNFVTNQRLFSFNESQLTKKNIFIRIDQGFHIGLVPKIYELTGNSSVLSKEAFHNEVIKGIEQGLSTFNYKKSHTFVEQSKLYYINIYPYLADNNTYYLSYELFSQHSCITPIYSQTEIPFSAKGVKNTAQLVAEDIEKRFNVWLANTTMHDGLWIVDEKKVNRKSWEQLGYQLQPKEKASVITGTVKHGRYSAITGKAPAVSFSFLPPASQYAGIIQEVTGDLQVSKEKIQGILNVRLKSLDMGDESLNEAVLSEQINVDQFSQAQIKIDSKLESIPYNELVPISGTLTFLGIERPVLFETQFIPINIKEETYLIRASTQFSIKNDESLHKPDGPSPEVETIQIATNLLIKKAP